MLLAILSKLLVLQYDKRKSHLICFKNVKSNIHLQLRKNNQHSVSETGLINDN